MKELLTSELKKKANAKTMIHTNKDRERTWFLAEISWKIWSRSWGMARKSSTMILMDASISFLAWWSTSVDCRTWVRARLKEFTAISAPTEPALLSPKSLDPEKLTGTLSSCPLSKVTTEDGERSGIRELPQQAERAGLTSCKKHWNWGN